jgi:transposase
VNYKGSLPKPNPKQLKSLDSHLEKNIYIRVQDMVFHIEETYGVSFQGMTDLLKRLGYVYKKPKKLPGKHPKSPQILKLRVIHSLIISRNTAMIHAHC